MKSDIFTAAPYGALLYEHLPKRNKCQQNYRFKKIMLVSLLLQLKLSISGQNARGEEADLS